MSAPDLYDVNAELKDLTKSTKGSITTAEKIGAEQYAHTRAAVDELVGKPPSYMRKIKGRTARWYDLARRQARLARQHREVLILYVETRCQWEALVAVLNGVKECWRFEAEYKHLHVQLRSYHDQMLSAQRAINSTAAGRPPESNK